MSGHLFTCQAADSFGLDSLLGESKLHVFLYELVLDDISHLGLQILVLQKIEMGWDFAPC